jgi:hypothetical protein
MLARLLADLSLDHDAMKLCPFVRARKGPTLLRRTLAERFVGTATAHDMFFDPYKRSEGLREKGFQLLGNIGDRGNVMLRAAFVALKRFKGKDQQ